MICKSCEEKDAEIERLRGALEIIHEYYSKEFREGNKAYQAVLIAEQALERKSKS